MHAAELERQAAEWAALTARYERVIVAGDFNQAFRTPGYGTNALRHQHRESYRAAGLVCLTDGLVIDGQPVTEVRIRTRLAQADAGAGTERALGGAAVTIGGLVAS